jgi:hypothetical protein
MMRAKTAEDRETLSHLQNELRKADAKLARLYEAVENGLPLDETLRQRIQKGKAGGFANARLRPCDWSAVLPCRPRLQ